MSGPKRNLCQLCEIRWAQDRARLCRRCARAVEANTGDSYARLPDDHRVSAFHGHLNGYPLGARCAVHFAAPPRTVELEGRLVEVTWNGT